MYTNLVCPICKGKLDYSNNSLTCNKCMIVFQVEEGIPYMLPEMARKNNRTEDLEEIQDIKEKVKEGYSMVDDLLKSSGLASLATFLNLGYSVNMNPQSSQLEPQITHLNKHSVRLLLEVIGSFNMNNKRILEIGCGRGGNISTINEYYKPCMSWGLDLCEANIRFCKSRYKIDNLSFCVGDAEMPPFSDDFFDAVVNIESADSYPNINKFYSGVYSILKSGGHFMYADVRPVKGFEDCVDYMKEIGFDVLRNTDITSNVLLACDETAQKRVGTFGNIKSDKILDSLENFLTVPGSKLYEDMKCGKQSYRILELVKK